MNAAPAVMPPDNPKVVVMKRKLSRLISIFMIFALCGCASMQTVMKSWVGKPIDDVTASWGAPESKMPRSDGGYTYTWTTFSSNQYGVHQCRQSFVTNSEGTVVSWSFNGCPRFVIK